jgi:hypothetical protein
VLDEETGHGKFGLKFTVANVGKKTAPDSNLAVDLGGAEIDIVEIPELKPGDKDVSKVSYDQHFEEIDTYKAFVCANNDLLVDESDTGNNCNARKQDIRIRAVPQTWRAVDFTLRVTFFAYEWYTESDLDFVYAGLSGNQSPQFLWRASGSVTETLSGSDGDCTLSGTHTVDHPLWGGASDPVGYLSIDDNLTKYSAEVDPGAIYVGHAECVDPESSGDVPYPMSTLFTGDPGQNSSQTFTGQYLIDSYEYSPGGGAVHRYEWLFGALIPPPSP